MQLNGYKKAVVILEQKSQAESHNRCDNTIGGRYKMQ